MQSLYTLIIDTNLYSGNFECQMCGYITAQVGECNAGEDEAVKAKNELNPTALAWFEEHIEQRAEENADFLCMRRPAPLFPRQGVSTMEMENIMMPRTTLEKTVTQRTRVLAFSFQPSHLLKL